MIGLKNRLIALLLFGFPMFAGAQVMWPGDINNNGIVNAVDLLWHGLAFGAHGSERPGGSVEWQAQALGMPWEESFPQGLNMAYADCNGDGFVDDADVTDAVLKHFRRTHGDVSADGYPTAPQNAIALPLTLVPSATSVEPGQVLTIDVHLGNAQQPVQQFYGIALKMHYSTGVVENNGSAIGFNIPDSVWIDPANTGVVEHLFFRDTTNGDIEVAMVRTDQQTVSGSGGICSFSIIIEDIIVGYTSQFTLRVDSIMLIDNHDTLTYVAPDTVVVPIKAKSRNRELAAAPSTAMRVSPNPSGPEAVWILETPAQVRRLELTDGLGRTRLLQAQAEGGNRYSVVKPADLPPGAYWLRAHTDEGVLHTQVVHWK